ncbi:cell division protein FtsW [Gracilibacillus boraciitolerans JCM 21714]|uniref:Probable peptidoglycan glycosyltransferase FtsW n=1 Tax=Gracilibacillus boraciitolerans JCM 21714 TaxID=1298598 RepID=W4VG39_9BACI|nr:FtsW/RodA/SpoVE family cell cycle protein [Gracilibacillus boraciitolerans]GAE91783.1 cell division protein FtsW [Gracilibacillus boraciitolerans JCM 21714]
MSIIVLRGLFIAKKCENAFGSLLAIGISAMIGIQAIINLGAISGLLPITGVPLPFVSYGGTSLVVLLFSVGILNNIARHVNYQRFNEETVIPDQSEKNVQFYNRKRRQTTSAQ